MSNPIKPNILMLNARTTVFPDKPHHIAQDWLPKALVKLTAECTCEEPPLNWSRQQLQCSHMLRLSVAILSLIMFTKCLIINVANVSRITLNFPNTTLFSLQNDGHRVRFFWKHFYRYPFRLKIFSLHNSVESIWQNFFSTFFLC